MKLPYPLKAETRNKVLSSEAFDADRKVSAAVLLRNVAQTFAFSIRASINAKGRAKRNRSPKRLLFLVPEGRYGRQPSDFATRSGFTIIEVLISVAIVAIVAVGLVLFERDLFSVNDALSEALRAEQQAGPVLKEIISHIRTASPSSMGSYPIVALGSTTLTLYANTDSDNLKERLRYFKEGNTLKLGFLKPTGSPAVYIETNEKIKPVVRNLVSTTTPLFSYFDALYAGTTSPMQEPIDVNRVRIIKVTFVIDKDPVKLPDPLVFSSQVLIRNLKDSQ